MQYTFFIYKKRNKHNFEIGQNKGQLRNNPSLKFLILKKTCRLNGYCNFCLYTVLKLNSTQYHCLVYNRHKCKQHRRTIEQGQETILQTDKQQCT